MHGALGQCGDGEGWIDAGVGGDGGAVDDVEAVVAKDFVVDVDDAFFGVGAHACAAEDMGGAGRSEDGFGEQAHGDAAGFFGPAFGQVGGFFHEGGGCVVGIVELGDQGFFPAGEDAAAQAKGERAVEGAHVEQDLCVVGPVGCGQGARPAHGFFGEAGQGAAQACGDIGAGRVGQANQAEEAGAAAVAYGFDVAVVVGVQNRGDGESAGDVGVFVGLHDAEEGFAVGADEVADASGESGQGVGIFAQGKQQGNGAHDAAGKDDTVGGEGFGLPGIGDGGAGFDEVAAFGAWANAGDFGFGFDSQAASFGEPEVVVVERVFGVESAAGHAGAALDASGAGGAFAAKIRIFDFFAGFAEVDGYGGFFEVIESAHVPGDGFEYVFGLAAAGVLGGSEHAARGLVVRGEFLFPVRAQVGPGFGLEEVVSGDGQGVGVDEGAAADADAVHDGDVFHEGHLEQAGHAEFGFPHPASDVPVGFGEVFGGHAAAFFDGQDFVAFFDQAQGRNAAAEAGADDDPVKMFGGGGVGLVCWTHAPGTYGRLGGGRVFPHNSGEHYTIRSDFAEL